VQLQVSLDDTAGTATVTWTPYDGEAEFAAYWVLRNLPREAVVETLASIAASDCTRFVDASLDVVREYVYRVSVVNDGGLEVPSQAVLPRPLRLPTADLTDLVLNSRTAAALLTWRRYAGPRFHHYRVERQQADLQATLDTIADQDVVTYTDSLLRGNTEYTYRVVVVTADGVELPGAALTRSIHPLVDTWSLEIDADGRGGDPVRNFHVRLYHEPGDRITALIAGHERVRLLIFSTDGELIDEQILLDLPFHGDVMSRGVVATALDADRQRLLLVSGRSQDQSFALLAYDLDGVPIRQDTVLYDEPFLADLPEAMRSVESTIWLVGSPDFAFRDLVVERDGGVVYQEDFGDVPAFDAATPWEGWVPATPPWGWSDKSGYCDHETADRGLAEGARGWLLGYRPPGIGHCGIAKSGTDWRGIELAVDAVTSEYSIGVGMGGDTGSRFELGLGTAVDDSSGGWSLRWDYAPASADAGDPATDVLLDGPLAFLSGVPYRIRFLVADGRVRVAVASNVVWHRQLGAVYRRGGLTAIDDRLALAAEHLALAIDEDLTSGAPSSLDHWVGEVRAWRVDDQSRTRVGVCLPQANQVRTGIAVRASAWASTVSRSDRRFDAHHTPGAPSLLWPVSMDGGSDGRVYVLDAGNARVVAFDGDGNYLTEWGGFGDGPTQFHFGDGSSVSREVLNYGGSICVDDEGYIYVADVGNGRIQKFAP